MTTAKWNFPKDRLCKASVVFTVLIGSLTGGGCASGEFNVCNFGAVGDGTTLNTQAIQSAVDRCSENGGGRVVIPTGRFLSGTIIIKDNVELHLTHSAVLLGSIRHEDYPCQPTPAYRSLKDSGGFFALLYAEGANHIAVTGSGTIDGQGSQQQPLPDRKKNDRDGRPRIICFISCKNVQVTGVHLRNSGIWMQHYLNCDNVHVEGLDVYNHSNRNNDGIDIDGCRRVTVANCHFDTDDDAVCLKSTGLAPCEDVVINNCTVSSHCAAIKMGTESTGGFKRIVISNCTISPSTVQTKFYGRPEGKSGIELLTVDGGTMEGVTISNITIHKVYAPFCLRLGNRARRHTEDAPPPGVGVMRNICLSNIIATETGDVCASISGIPGHTIENVTLNNIQLFCQGGLADGDFLTDVPENEDDSPGARMWGILPGFGMFIRHAKDVRINGLVLATAKSDARWPIWAEDVADLCIENARVQGPVSQKTFVRGMELTNHQVQCPHGWDGQVVEVCEKQK